MVQNWSPGEGSPVSGLPRREILSPHPTSLQASHETGQLATLSDVLPTRGVLFSCPMAATRTM